MKGRRTGVLVCALFLAGCYHATINTGATPGPQRIERKWAAGWIAGLVPPSTVEAMAQCPSGVARVDTQLSFANQLVGWLTAYIFTPMSIEVVCAAQGDQANAVNSTGGWLRAIELGGPFYVATR